MREKVQGDGSTWKGHLTWTQEQSRKVRKGFLENVTCNLRPEG